MYYRELTTVQLEHELEVTRAANGPSGDFKFRYQ